MKLFKIYSNGHSRELCPESEGNFFTSVVDAATVNPIRLGGGGRSSKNLRSSDITIFNSAKTSIPPGGDGRIYSLNSVDVYIV